MDERILIALADPEGSGLYNKACSNNVKYLGVELTYLQVKYGVMFDPKESEGTKRRHQVRIQHVALDLYL